MLICSIDVGIKNLAYCIFDSSNYNIVKWDIIDIIDSDKLVCGGIIKGGKVCGKKASLVGYTLDKKQGPSYFCGTHKVQHKDASIKDCEGVYSIELSPDTVDTCTHAYPKKDTLCAKSAKFKCDDNLLCAAHNKSYVNNLIKDTKLKKIPRKKATSTDPKGLALSMFQKMDKIPELIKVGKVLIENQPALKNPTMKTISCFIMSYFVMRGVVDIQSKRIKDGEIIEDIRFISPSKKLSLQPDQVINILSKITSKDDVYTAVDRIITEFIPEAKPSTKFSREAQVKLVIGCLLNKKVTLEGVNTQLKTDGDAVHKLKLKLTRIVTDSKELGKELKCGEKIHSRIYNTVKLLSIKYTYYLLETLKQPIWLKHLKDYKKKDDMCDAFIQGYSYLQKKLI